MATTFIDKARITVRAGNGGNGAVAFHREKYVAAGGPDGGDGGKGGSIILQVDDNMSTLMDFRYKRKYVAENGVDGQGRPQIRQGRREPCDPRPRGTLVRDAETNEIIKDMSGDEPYVLCKGGRGGWGNMHFATPHPAGSPLCQGRSARREPRCVSGAEAAGGRGPYRVPQCGQVHAAERGVQGTAQNCQLPLHHPVSQSGRCVGGRGRFLCHGGYSRHHRRRQRGRGPWPRLPAPHRPLPPAGTRGRRIRQRGAGPVADFDAINAELEQYSPDLAGRPQIVAANKVDIMADPENLERLRTHVEAKGFALMEISAAAHQGTRELVGKVAEMLAALPPVTVYEPEYVPKPPVVDTSEPLDIQRLDDGHTWLIQGPWLQRLMANVNFDDYESRMWFDKALRESGLYRQLEERGIQDGDTVSLDGYEFEYQI